MRWLAFSFDQGLTSRKVHATSISFFWEITSLHRHFSARNLKATNLVASRWLDVSLSVSPDISLVSSLIPNTRALRPNSGFNDDVEKVHVQTIHVIEEIQTFSRRCRRESSTNQPCLLTFSPRRTRFDIDIETCDWRRVGQWAVDDKVMT